MLDEAKNSLIILTTSLKEDSDTIMSRTLSLELFERCVKRIFEFSDSCTECESFVYETNKILKKLENSPGEIKKPLLEEHRLNLRKIINHLQKEHKLVRDGQFFELYMPTGIALGLPFGLLIGNLALGFSFGLIIGTALGTAQDANAKKKGQLI